MIDSVQYVTQFGAAFAHAIFDGLWVGLAVALVVFLVMRALPGLNAASRHAGWYAALLVIALLPYVSFAASLAHVRIASAHGHMPIASAEPRPYAASWLPPIASVPPPTQRAIAFLRNAPASPEVRHWAEIAGLGVSAVAAARILVLLSSLIGLARVKRASRVVDPAIAPRLARAIARDPGARAVDVRISDTLETPAAAGFRKPAILLPAALLDSLDSEALGQIALHEYAHLRRYDDWTNLAQRLIERLYWFNPAIWFVAARIDLERELACDDWAVAGADGVSRYADCLWHLARNGRVSVYAATAPGAFLTRNQVVARIEHLLQRHDAAPTWRPAKLLAVAPALAAAIALVIWRAPAIALHKQVAVAATRIEAVACAHKHEPAGTAVIARVLSTSRAIGHAPAAPAVPAVRIAAGTVAVVAHSARVITAPIAVVTGRAVTASLHRATVPAKRATPQRVLTTASLAMPQVVSYRLHYKLVNAVHQLREEAIRVRYRFALPKTAMHVDANAPQVATAVQQAVVDQAAANAEVASTEETDNRPSNAIDRNMLAHCKGCDLSGKDLRNADLHDISLTGDDLSGADLRGANLRGAVFTGVDLSDAKLDGADLRDTVFTGSNIDGATFAGARIEGIKLVGMQLNDSILDGASARAIISACVGCDLSGLNLRGRDLHGLMLSGVDLSGTDLSGANLSGAHFNGVDLENARLVGTDLRNAVMNGCNLTGADLTRARTDGLRLRGTSGAWDNSN